LTASPARVLYQNPSASSVALAAPFTGWQRAPLPLLRGPDGVFSITLSGVAPGLHPYKLIVDGRWVVDPAHRLRCPDGLGGQNSVLLAGGPGPAPEGALRVLSLNLHTYQERDPLEKLRQVALGAAALGAGLLLLQEVGEHVSDPGRPNAGEVLRGHLAALTGRPWDHAWAEAHIGFDVYREGLSILAPGPLAGVERVVLRDGPLARVALVASVDLGGTPTRVVSVHTTWPPQGSPEVDALLAHLGPGPALVAGDFNGPPGAAHVRKMLAAGFVDAGAERGLRSPTFLEAPVELIDYQLARGPRCRGIWRLFDGEFLPRVSDHAGLLGDHLPAPDGGRA